MKNEKIKCPKCKKRTFEALGTEDTVCYNCKWHENSLGEKWFEKERVVGEMSELRTLKDINGYDGTFCPHSNDLVIREDLKQEAIKWWIKKFNHGDSVCCTCEEICREFFNITLVELSK